MAFEEPYKLGHLSLEAYEAALNDDPDFAQEVLTKIRVVSPWSSYASVQKYSDWVEQVFAMFGFVRSAEASARFTPVIEDIGGQFRDIDEQIHSIWVVDYGLEPPLAGWWDYWSRDYVVVVGGTSNFEIGDTSTYVTTDRARDWVVDAIEEVRAQFDQATRAEMIRCILPAARTRGRFQRRQRSC